ncbi:esterase PHB depolymerase domain protein [Bacteriovorax sp. BSW11_IV]|uniref:extracellular catalytic domain type 2 short-chain-length polyhydroxyalkanoate depolymerase n=1 Tax=Bacteriovorax sp. BSW11_IV TaxID=1353529 RepID=UPI00038A503D|nr:PHB depolymerase family esterase [Bacteriovorax sp. BSW11_IV]EQC48418.1 esterase PHB depolymerase domain protein [Bacteriovorax sp. BSW11_IV]
MKILTYISVFITFLTLTYSNTLAISYEKNKVTVSGISSGAFFAHQYHIAFSEDVEGAALFAGGPFYCSSGDIPKALTNCMKKGPTESLAKDSMAEIKTQLKKKRIDPTKNLYEDRVYIFTGTNDTIVLPEVAYQLKKLYTLLKLEPSNIRFVDWLPAGHAYPTNHYGNDCETAAKTPYISNCHYNGALESLSYLYPNREIITAVEPGQMRTFSQDEKEKNNLQKEAYLYVPKYCQENSCPLHVAFHGCSQTIDHIEMSYIENTGIKQAADSLRVAILFPQAKKSALPFENPHGCWDWWGHAGRDFHTKKGAQMSAIHKLINEVLEKGL